MPETKTYTVYRFDELSDDAKDRARDWYRNASASDTFFSEHVIEDFAHIAALLGIDVRTKPVRLMGGGTRYDPAVYWSLGYTQGDFASFECSYSYKRGGLRAVREYAPRDTALHRIAERLQAVQRRNFYQVYASSEADHRGGMRVSVDTAMDWHSVSDDDAEEVKDCMSDLADWLYKSIREAHDWYNADEQVDESIRANEYTFDEEGNRED